MWNNPDAEQMLPLSPQHAAVFRAGASILSDGIGWSPETDYMEAGFAAFDRLTQGQKQGAILEVSRALLLPNITSPPLTAALAATIASIYGEYQGIIEGEIDCGDGRTTNRAMLLAALMETNFWEEDNLDMAQSRLDQPPSPDSNDFEEWEFLVQCLRTVVLPDNDFEMEESFLDLPPEKGALLKDHLGIQSDYFLACPEDPSAERLEAIRRELQALLW